MGCTSSSRYVISICPETMALPSSPNWLYSMADKKVSEPEGSFLRDYVMKDFTLSTVLGKGTALVMY